jgi:GT2 family glycosyltransferase/lipopolysaccharide/colanic/teichoic acid biosynthesis glycosyltransferase
MAGLRKQARLHTETFRRASGLDVSVIIVNYNVRDFLHQALVSIQKALEGIRSEIVVVDNASDDGSAEMVRRQFPRVKLIINASNFGFAKANNIALKQTRGKFLLLINPDTIVQEDTIRVMVDFLNNHPEVGLAGCKILNPDGSIELACRRSFPTPWIAFSKIFGLSKLFPKTKLFGKYNLTYLNIEETNPVEAVSGSFMMVRKETLKQVGGLDENFFMYGEDLDWCYRIHQAGWQIYYVHSTQIVHYKGESTRRSNMDEIYTFYEAMRLFVDKHVRSSSLFSMVLRMSIALVSFAAFLNSILRPLKIAFLDFIAVTISLLLAEEIWTGRIFHYPAYAYPVVFSVPAVIVIGCLYAAGVYTQRRMSISRSIIATFFAYILISALTAFFRDFAFSRMIVVISGIFAMVLIPGWRLIFRILGKTTPHGRGTLFGKRTLIVGTDKNAIGLQRKLRTRVGEGYEIVGFVGTTHKHIGEMLNGVQVLGSIDNVGKIIKKQKISDVIFAPQALSYTQILSVIGRSREQAVAFHLVPTTMEVIVGKASVDSLDNLPLVQIAYNIDKPFHRFTKRVFDLVFSGLLLITVYPIFRLFSKKERSESNSFIGGLSNVFSGRMSFVGPPLSNLRAEKPISDSLFLGKPGLCGLVQLQQDGTLSNDEINQYYLYYARNQSVLLDLEILIKTWLRFRVLRKKSKEKMRV